ncbi:SDR family NAD(P)-dependent oxidoreductase [Sphingomonas sp. MMS24-J13]|uniref:SDR family NAD(P)-dependent oxidoreductase n=1 Tax=Sphingomonas sp. MMS24-J13 TaxID=3238686 RepID=UPI00385176DD
MDLELGGKSVVICGGARGIGRACAEAFVREGARVAIFDWNADLLAEARQAMGHDILAVQVDVSDAASVDAAHAQAIETFGAIDVGFNNAGINSPPRAIEDTSEEDWDRVINVNLKGIWLCTRAQVRHMRPRNRGSIINTTSNVAFTGAPGFAAYVAAKHGIVGITRTVALELAKTEVRINAIAPGTVRTSLGGEMRKFVDPFADALIRKGLPIGRFGEPSEVADAVLWLASPRSSFALGSTLVIDGGFTAQ